MQGRIPLPGGGRGGSKKVTRVTGVTRVFRVEDALACR
jgi:hypothetical protein